MYELVTAAVAFDAYQFVSGRASCVVTVKKIHLSLDRFTTIDMLFIDGVVAVEKQN